MCAQSLLTGDVTSSQARGIRTWTFWGPVILPTPVEARELGARSRCPWGEGPARPWAVAVESMQPLGSQGPREGAAWPLPACTPTHGPGLPVPPQHGQPGPHAKLQNGSQGAWRVSSPQGGRATKHTWRWGRQGSQVTRVPRPVGDIMTGPGGRGVRAGSGRLGQGSPGAGR